MRHLHCAASDVQAACPIALADATAASGSPSVSPVRPARDLIPTPKGASASRRRPGPTRQRLCGVARGLVSQLAAGADSSRNAFSLDQAQDGHYNPYATARGKEEVVT
jgi:hypothetical protein